MENEIIKHINIIDGKTKYNGDDILRSKELYSLINQNTFNLPSALFDKIIIENGTILVNIEKGTNKFIVDLKNVSPQLYDLFFQKYKQGLL